MKHIIGQAVYQTIIMLVFYFAGFNFLPEEIDAGQQQDESQMVVSGLEIQGYDIASTGPSRHFTYNFNVFVMLQIFNFLNARKLQDEFNVFEGMEFTSFFSVIVLSIFVLQAFILTFGDIAFRCAKWGLGIKGWLITIAFGSFSLVVSMLLKLIKEEEWCGLTEEHGIDLTELNKRAPPTSGKKGSLSRMNSLSVRRFGKGSNKGSSGINAV